MAMTTGFVRNQWYVAAATDEIGDRAPLARTVCGEHIVLFRTGEGIVALPDRCSHRAFPLSLGEVVGDEIQCGYHGLRFDGCGRCTWAPNQTHIPSRADLAPYPLALTGPWVWVWIGDPDAADPGLLVDLPWLDHPDWKVLNGLEPLAARYSLLVDNLLDLSHESFLHAGYIGTPEVALTPIDTTVDDEAGIVRVSRRMAAVECPPFYADNTGMQTPIDRWQDIEYHPVCCYVLHVRVAPAGVDPGPDGADPRAAHLKVLYGITPSTAGTTLDFWALCRDFARDSAEVDQQMAAMQTTVVLQDVEALEALEARLAEESEPAEVSLKIDSGGLAARRLIAALASRRDGSGPDGSREEERNRTR
jgi:phenylpropionate dioxygenase-like ring-hydroxylating dioxygenase large terminal subunit